MQPEDVQRAVQGEVGDAAVQRVPTALRADPAWIVLEPVRSGPEGAVQLVYRPTGTPYGLPATRAGADTWRFRERPGWLKG